MSHDDVPLPTNKTRRRSIFDDHNDIQGNENATSNFPSEPSELYYPIEYIEKVRTETHLWKMHIKKALEELQKFKVEKRELQRSAVDENILSPEQYEILDSFKFDEYTRRVQNFCNRAAVIAHKIQYKAENDVANKLLSIQSKLEKEIMKRQIRDGEA